jgi:hypothetical protein
LQAAYARPDDGEDADAVDADANDADANDADANDAAVNDAAEDERAAPAAQLEAHWARLHAQYGTTPAAITLWEEVRADLSCGDNGVYTSIADAEILQAIGDRVVLGIPQPAQMRRLEHPFFRTAIRRAFKRHLRKLPALELVATYTAESEPAAVQAALTLG